MSADGFIAPALPAPADAAAIEAARARLRAQARLVRAQGRLEAALLPMLVLAVSLALHGWGLVALLPHWAQALCALGGVAVLGWGIWRVARVPAPGPEAARRRLEADQGLEPGLIAPLDDRPQGADPISERLWQASLSAAVAAVSRLPAPDLGRTLLRTALAPGRVRLMVGAIALSVVAAMTAVALAPGGARATLSALDPRIGALFGDGPLLMEAWAVPPDYVDEAPRQLSDPSGDIAVLGLRFGPGRIDLPPAAEVSVRLVGPVAPPVLRWTGPGGQSRVVMSRAEDGAWEGRIRLGSGSGRVEVHRLGTLASWPLRVATDAPPTVAFTRTPTRGAREGLDFAWSGQDDLGIIGAALELTLVAPPPGLAAVTTAEVPVTMEGDPRAPEVRSRVDLTRHPFAGLEVDVRMLVRDGPGQVGRSEPVRLHLPERAPTQPLARAALEIRAALVREARPFLPAPVPPTLLPEAIPRGPALVTPDNRLSRAPEGVHRAHALLVALTARPEGYFTDAPVWFGLATARFMLEAARDHADTARVADLLWDIAERAEFGAAADTASALEQAMSRLREAAARGASPEEIRELADAVRQAMAAHLQALAEQAEGAEPPPDGVDPGQARELDAMDLEQLLADAQAAAEQGDAADAMQLLEQLQGLIDNMEVRTGEGGEGGEQGQVSAGGGAGGGSPGEALAGAMAEQRALRDESFRAGNEGRTPGGDAAGRQGALADRLETLRQGMGPRDSEAGDPLGDAIERMREAQRALEEGDARGAEAAQDQALGALRSAARDMRGDTPAPSRAEGAQGSRDPLGRQGSTAATDGGEDVRVPDRIDPQRAREILEDLRRRAADPRRPEEERAYLRRLLERFGDTAENP